MRLGFNSSAPLLEMLPTKCLPPSPEPFKSRASACLGTRMNSLLSFAAANLMRPEEVGRFILLSRPSRTEAFAEGSEAFCPRLPERSMTGHEPDNYRPVAWEGGVGGWSSIPS